jgi:hypothetical protein
MGLRPAQALDKEDEMTIIAPMKWRSNPPLYFLTTVLRPRQSFQALATDPNQVRRSFVVMLIMALCYTMAILFLALSQTHIEFALKPFLRIPEESYYFWETFLIAPVLLLDWILVAAVVHLFSKFWHGQGSFETTLSLLGYSIAIPTYLTLIPDAITGLLSALGILNQVAWVNQLNTPGSWAFLFVWTIMLAEVLWIAALFTLALRTAQGISWRKAGLVGILGFILYQALLLVFLR